ncbi:hypothetical protein [Maledivibacter halophilus]|uniref:hypothetical protein n=1 Tax=Maledivibacter halophilus TaxID=36842 RepID=UPI001AD93F16|nr:hypothetical protein [Maledivibacter halophilus]
MDIRVKTVIFSSLILLRSTDKLFGKNRSPAVIIFGALSALMVTIAILVNEQNIIHNRHR